MRWSESGQMSERTQFIAEALAGERAMTVLCREYGISRKTGYKWLERYRREGACGSVRIRRCAIVGRMRWRLCKRCRGCATAGRMGAEETAGCWASSTRSCRCRRRAQLAIGCSTKGRQGSFGDGRIVRPIRSSADIGVYCGGRSLLALRRCNPQLTGGRRANRP